MKSFASDNYSGIAPEILQAIISANVEHQPSYGNDPFTIEATELLQHCFGGNCKAYFAYNGTAANAAALKAVLRSHHSIIASDVSHIAVHEVGAVNYLTGCPTLLIPHQDGKITAAAIKALYEKTIVWGQHTNLPKAISIAQSTELGTVYSVEELRAIATVCKELNLLFHMDGCRLSNAAVSLNISLAALTHEVGVDVLSFGGTKNGLMLGEAIIFFREDLAQEFEYIHKQNLQLNSKMRFLSTQFIPYIKDNLWHRYASHANKMCQRLADGLHDLPGVTIAYTFQTNQLFVHLPEKIIKATIEKYPYYFWDKSKNIARLVTSFDTTEQEVDDFVKLCR